MISIESILEAIRPDTSPARTLARLAGVIGAHDEVAGKLLADKAGLAACDENDSATLQRLLNSTAYGGPNA